MAKSDQPGHLPSLIRVFTRRSVGSFFMWTANTLIRLSKCPDSPELLLGVQVILSVLCGGSFGIAKPCHNQFCGCLATTELLHIDEYFYC